MRYLVLALMLLGGAALWLSPKGSLEAMTRPSVEIVPIDQIEVVNAEKMKKKIGLQILQNKQRSRLVHLTVHLDLGQYLSDADVAAMPSGRASFFEAVAAQYAAEECARLKVALARTCEAKHADGRGPRRGLSEIKMTLRILPKTRIEGIVPGGRYTFVTKAFKNRKFKFNSYRQMEDWRAGVYAQVARDCQPMVRQNGSCEVSMIAFQAYPPTKGGPHRVSRSYILSSLRKI